MGGVELLSREGEIAIAKRIEASRSTMMVGIFGSPSSLDIISDWHKKLSKGDMLLREIIDCESTYNKTPEGKANVKTADNALDATSGKLMYSKSLVNSNFDEVIDDTKKEQKDFNKIEQTDNKENKNVADENQDDNSDNEDVDDEFLSLTSIEDIIKPSVDKAFKRIKQIKKSFLRVNGAKFDLATSGKQIKESIKKKEVELIKELTEIFDNIILNNNAIEFLVDVVYGKNKKALNIETAFL
jgi:RNA polymerase primary sigma factor